MKIFEGYEPDFLETKEVYGQTDHCVIIGLEPDTEYLGRVQVFNSAGRGPKGQWRIAETARAGEYYENMQTLRKHVRAIYCNISRL